MAHKQIAFESQTPPDGYGSPAYCAIIPAGTVPAIIHDDFKLSDSEAIAEYLNELVPEPGMLPDTIQSRAKIREVSRFHDTRLEPVLRAFFSQVAPSQRNPDFILENSELLQKRLYQLAQIAAPSPLLAGDQLTIADCSFVASFAIFGLLRDEIGLDVEMPQILQHYDMALCSHASVTAERKRYETALAEWAAGKRNT